MAHKHFSKQTFTFLALAFVFALTLPACSDPAGETKPTDNTGGNDKSKLDNFEAWLAAQPDNAKTNPYFYTLKLSSFPTDGRIRSILLSAPNKYLNLDFSGSSFTGIPDWAFDEGISSGFLGCETLTGITLPANVKSIGESSFYNCRNLSNIIIPNTVASIGVCAFAGCISFTSVTIPNSVNNIGGGAFSNCTGLASVEFKGAIPKDDFAPQAFDGDLRTKFYATDPNNGTPGRYTTTAPVSYSSVWTLQP